MSRRLSYRLDPAALFADVVGAPDACQRKALRSDSKRQLYLASRQSGKSSVAALKVLHAAIVHTEVARAPCLAQLAAKPRDIPPSPNGLLRPR